MPATASFASFATGTSGSSGAGGGVSAAWPTCTFAVGTIATVASSHTGQSTSEASFCRAKSSADANQPSNVCPRPQANSKMIIPLHHTTPGAGRVLREDRRAARADVAQRQSVDPPALVFHRHDAAGDDRAQREKRSDRERRDAGQ